MRYFEFLLGTLSVWRITHLLQAEDGPWDSVIYLRRKAGDGFWGQLLDCFYCLSIWIAVPLSISLGKSLSHKILFWPAMSAGAILLERVTERGYGEPPAQSINESEDEYVLWKEAGTGPQNRQNEAGL